MEKYIEVMKQAIDISETMEEGLNHIQFQLNNGRYEESVILFEDLFKGYASMENALKPIVKEFKTDEVTHHLTKMQQAFEIVVSAYESKEYGHVKEVIQFTLLPQTIELKQKLRVEFDPFLMS